MVSGDKLLARIEHQRMVRPEPQHLAEILGRRLQGAQEARVSGVGQLDTSPNGERVLRPMRPPVNDRGQVARGSTRRRNLEHGAGDRGNCANSQ